MNTPETAAEIVKARDLFEEIKKLSYDGRRELSELLNTWWCHYCGGNKRCQCWNDE